MSVARETFAAALGEFRQLAKVEIAQLDRDAAKLRVRGFPRLAADLVEWGGRLQQLVALADDAMREHRASR